MLVVAGYLLGAVPFGVVVSKAMGLPDPRTVGSKNVGFTNVLRVFGKKAGILTLIGDMGKGWVMGFAANQLLQDEWTILLVALAPILGHLCSPFLGFTGGKGGCELGRAMRLQRWPNTLVMLAPLFYVLMVKRKRPGRRPCTNPT